MHTKTQTQTYTHRYTHTHFTEHSFHLLVGFNYLLSINYTELEISSGVYLAWVTVSVP